MLLTLLVVFTGVTLLTYGASADVARRLQSDAQTERVLALAKQALVARAVADQNRPGSLPCPDIIGDGNAPGTVGTGTGNPCPRYIGRLPWRTLGLGDLRDASGERLWYVLSPNFRDATGIRINSDTHGTLTVHGGGAAHVVTGEAAAVIIAPGSAFGDQVRDGTVAPCPTTGTQMPNALCAANYLESGAGWNNASAGGPHLVAQPGALFNDRVAVLRTSDFMPLVEQRIARELRDVLLEYQESAREVIPADGCGHGCFPWPDASNDGKSDPGQNRGRLPLAAAPHQWGSTGKGKTAVSFPDLPPYFAQNEWQNVIYYTVGRRALQELGKACVTCDTGAELLTVNGVSAYELVLITPGAIGAGQTRTAWSHYITHPANRDENDVYVTPNEKVLNRNRLYSVAGVWGAVSCQANAQALLQNAPCHYRGTVKRACQQARDNLQQCTCSAAADTLVTVPCRNTLAPRPHCAEAVEELQVCKS